MKISFSYILQELGVSIYSHSCENWSYHFPRGFRAVSSFLGFRISGLERTSVTGRHGLWGSLDLFSPVDLPHNCLGKILKLFVLMTKS